MKFLKVTSKIALILTIFALFITCTGGQPESSLILFPQGPTRPPLGPGQSPDDVYDLGGGGFTPQLFTGNEGTWYQIFPISFYDTTGDGKGDLNGITHHLGYLSCELGCPAQLENVDDRTYCNNSLHIDGIWLTPIMKGTSYHKYDTEDYMSIDPDFGTLQDMRDLRDEARKRGIKLIVDLAVNHSSAVHPWFLNALEEWMSGDLGHYAHYYEIRTSWNRFPNKVHEFGTNDRWWRPDEMHLVIDALNERRQLKGQPPITEVRTPGGQYIFYYGIFGPWMPDFNFDNPDVKQEFVEITRFWLHEDEMDLDGFRLDATLHIYNAPGDWQGDHGRNIPFWEWFVDMARTFKPNVFLVGEAWTDPHTVLLYHTPGKSSFAFIFSLGGENRIVRAVNEGLGSIFSDGILWYTREIDFIRRTRPLALFSPFITSHDKNRSATQLHSLEQRKMSAALLLLSPGAPFVYYGEEIGLWGEKPQNESNDDRVVRGPMIFDMDFPSPGRPNPFLWYWKQSDWDNGQGLPTLVGNKQDGVREQMLDEDSLLRYFIRIQNIKKRYPWIAWGRVDDSGISRISGDGRNPGNIAVYRVTDNKPGSSTFGRSVVIAHNTSRGNNHEAVRLPRARGNYAISALGNAQFPFVIEGDDNIFWLKPYTTAIFEEFDRD